MRIRIVCTVFLMSFGILLSPAFAESLFNEETFVPLIADYRAIMIGDSVTIVIVESSLARASDGDRNSGSLNANAGGRLVTTNREEVGSGTLSLGYDADRDSATNRDGLFKAVVTADVVDVDLHGRLLLHGKQHLIVNGEDQYIAISGWVRPIHIDRDNTVVSSRISQAKIVYSGKDPDRISIWSRLKSVFCCGWFSEDEPMIETDASLRSQADYPEESPELDK